VNCALELEEALAGNDKKKAVHFWSSAKYDAYLVKKENNG
jgi:hypothetical protein